MGTHLGIKDAVINKIKSLNHSQPAPSRKDMLVKWLKSGRAKRADFIDALKAIGQHHIAQEILLLNGKDVAVLKPVITLVFLRTLSSCVSLKQSKCYFHMLLMPTMSKS